MLREKYYLSRKPPSRCPKLGEVVILSIDMPKVLWHLGRVIKLIPSADSVVREVEIITKNAIVRCIPTKPKRQAVELMFSNC